MPTNKEVATAKSICFAFLVCLLVATALFLTGCDSQPCATSPKAARAQGLSCWRDEHGTTYREVSTP